MGYMYEEKRESWKKRAGKDDEKERRVKKYQAQKRKR
jgi:hypothetical protein